MNKKKIPLTWKEFMRIIENTIVQNPSKAMNASIDVIIPDRSLSMMLIGMKKDTQNVPQLEVGYIGNEWYVKDLYAYMRREINSNIKDTIVTITSGLALVNAEFGQIENSDEWSISLYTERIK